MNQQATRMRWLLLLLVYLSCLIAYVDRMNMSVCAPMIMEHFGIDKIGFGLCMSAFSVAYTLMQIPRGMLSERFGIRVTGAAALICWSFFTFVTPLAGSFVAFVCVRFLFGLGEGPLFPNNGAFLTRWFGPHEKAISSSIMLSGAFIGPALAPPLAVWILNHWGWQFVFYAFGMAGFVLAPVWYCLSRNTPAEHPSVNEAELRLIGTAAASGNGRKTRAPWKQFLRSGQFWALGLQYFSVTYFLFLFLTWVPLYLLEVRGMTLNAMGFAAAAPWLASCLGVLISGKISDSLIVRGKSRFQARTVMAVAGLMGCGLFLYAGARASSPGASVALLSLAFGTLGFTITASWTVCQDLGRTHAGCVVAWLQTWANFGGACAPLFTGILVQWIGWELALTISASQALISAALWFLIRPDRPLATEEPDTLPTCGSAAVCPARQSC